MERRSVFRKEQGIGQDQDAATRVGTEFQAEFSAGIRQVHRLAAAVWIEREGFGFPAMIDPGQLNSADDRERGMQFYADKLCLTPKYLSKIVKEASGRSGPEWIDDFVILEAKNLLRYSDESIKEIAYKLNFPSASVFNKFFKAKTGLGPSDYRRGE